MELLSLKYLCLLVAALLLFIESSPVQGSCSEISQFTCKDETCIPKTWKCDGDADCHDGSDELDCPAETCSPEDFTCHTNQSCIPQRWQCDGEKDCGDGSDEDPAICAQRTCAADQFTCGVSSECIPMDWKCDGEYDCSNQADELNCDASCSPDEFTCTNKKCITVRWRCDSDDDCGDGSDEMECPAPTCSGDEFQCTDGRCIPSAWRCDGDVDCHDSSDEKECGEDQPEGKHHCSSSDFTCDNKECIHLTWKCDGDKDCTDESDEKYCNQTLCRDNQFKCNNNICIPGALQCDGTNDCGDDSDEQDCGVQAKPCTEDQFDCSRGHGPFNCIDMALVCDGTNDCGDYEDEGPFCHEADKCKEHNGGCSHTCKHDKLGSHCLCPKGLKIGADNKTCEDVNECEIPGTCSQECTNTKGGYKCSCVHGYTLEPSSGTCRADGHNPHLLFANRHDLRSIQLHTGEYLFLVENTRSAIALDYDYEEQTIYWSDVATEEISYSKMLTGNPADDSNSKTTLVHQFVSTPDGLAFDWVHKNLYWTDTGHNIIDVMNVKSSHRATLINANLDEPRALVVDPRPDQRFLYWSDWGESPRIEKAGLNGADRTTIVNNDISWPNGITIDYMTNRIFWVDAKLHLIGSSDLNGQHREVIFTSMEHLKHPFAITVFEDHLYWTDWETESIHKINKFKSRAGSDPENVALNLYSPMDIHVYHKLKQVKTPSMCGDNNGGCTHLCLPAPRVNANSPQYTCHCPNHPKGITWELQADQKTCIKVSEEIPTPVPGRTTPEPPTQAPTEETNFSGLQVQGVGKIAGIVVAIILGLALIGAIIGFFVYRSYMRKNVKSMNFDNPVYRKTTEDQFSLEKHQYQPTKNMPSVSDTTLEPLTAGGNEYV